MDGEHTDAGIKSVGEIVGPFGIDIKWTEDSTDEERLAAQPFVSDAMRTVSEDGDAMPKCIAALTIRRV